MSVLDRLVLTGDCAEVMRGMEDCSVDSIVCDPPYGLSKTPDIVDVLSHWLEGDDYVHKGGGFMGKTWDSFVPGPSVWRECLRVLKPGGHLLAFAGSRTVDLMGISIRLGGFEVRDTVMWMYATGFPKSLDVSKAIDKAAGAERSVIGSKLDLPGYHLHGHDGGEAFGHGLSSSTPETRAAAAMTGPATSDAEKWDGWGSALKPAMEPVIVARKPLIGTIVKNVLKHGTGAINIDGCRIGSGGHLQWSEPRDMGYHGGTDMATATATANGSGRWPANVILGHSEGCEEVGVRRVRSSQPATFHAAAAENNGNTSTTYGAESRPEGHVTPGYGDADGTEEVPVWECVEDCPVRMLDEQTGTSISRVGEPRAGVTGDGWGMSATGAEYADAGGASRFFLNVQPDLPIEAGASRFKYCAKANGRERHAGLPPKGNNHTTVKPIALMRYLVRLVTPPDGLCLDPFAGSGTTGIAAVLEGFRFVGIERDEDYAQIARARIEHAATTEGVQSQSRSATER